MKRILIIIGLLILLALFGIPYGIYVANASNITDAQYYGTVTITNNSTATSNVSANMTPISNMLINNFGVDTAFDRVAMRNSYGEDVKFMPGYATAPWIFWLPSIGANAQQNDILYSGNASLSSSKYIFTTAGITVADNAAMEAPSENFTLHYIAAVAKIDNYILHKDDIFELKRVSDNITLEYYNVDRFSLAADDGICDIYVYADGTNMWMVINDTSTANISVPTWINNGSNWIFGDHTDTVPFVGIFDWSVDGVQQCLVSWQYAASLTDQSGQGHTPSLTLRTSSSNANISANLTSWQPISPAQSTISGNATWPSMVTSVPDEPSTAYSSNTSPGFFFANVFNGPLDTAGIPRAFFWTNFAFLIIIGLGILVFFIKQQLVLKCIVMSVVMILFALEGINVYGMFVIIYFALYCFGIILLSRSYGW